MPTETVPDTPIIKGHDFSKGGDLDSIMSAMITSGFQATALGQAIEEVNRMVSRQAGRRQSSCMQKQLRWSSNRLSSGENNSSTSRSSSRSTEQVWPAYSVQHAVDRPARGRHMLHTVTQMVTVGAASVQPAVPA